jgi:hypothetical protein
VFSAGSLARAERLARVKRGGVSSPRYTVRARPQGGVKRIGPRLAEIEGERTERLARVKRKEVGEVR